MQVYGKIRVVIYKVKTGKGQDDKDFGVIKEK